MGLFGKSEKEKRQEEWEQIKKQIEVNALKEHMVDADNDIEKRLDAIKEEISNIINSEVTKGANSKILQAQNEQHEIDMKTLETVLNNQKKTINNEIEAEIKEALKGNDNIQSLYHLGRLQRRVESV